MSVLASLACGSGLAAGSTLQWRLKNLQRTCRISHTAANVPHHRTGISGPSSRQEATAYVGAIGATEGLTWVGGEQILVGRVTRPTASRGPHYGPLGGGGDYETGTETQEGHQAGWGGVADRFPTPSSGVWAMFSKLSGGSHLSSRAPDLPPTPRCCYICIPLIASAASNLSTFLQIYHQTEKPLPDPKCLTPLN